MRYDLIIENKEREPILVLEVRNRSGVTGTWAEKYLRNILAHSSINRTKYFLLAFPDRFFIWNGIQNRESSYMPDFEVDPSRFLQPYFDKMNLTDFKDSEISLRSALISWFSDLRRGNITAETKKYNRAWLLDTKLIDEIKKSSFRYEVTLTEEMHLSDRVDCE